METKSKNRELQKAKMTAGFAGAAVIAGGIIANHDAFSKNLPSDDSNNMDDIIDTDAKDSENFELDDILKDESDSMEIVTDAVPININDDYLDQDELLNDADFIVENQEPPTNEEEGDVIIASPTNMESAQHFDDGFDVLEANPMNIDSVQDFLQVSESKEDTKDSDEEMMPELLNMSETETGYEEPKIKFNTPSSIYETIGSHIIEPIKQSFENLLFKGKNENTSEDDCSDAPSSGIYHFERTGQMADASGRSFSVAYYHRADDEFPGIMADLDGDGIYDTEVDTSGHILYEIKSHIPVNYAEMQCVSNPIGIIDSHPYFISEKSFIGNITDTGSYEDIAENNLDGGEFSTD